MAMLGDRNRARTWHVGLALLVFAFVLRGWEFGNPVIHVDEQWYLLVGDRMRNGARPYLDLWDRKPLGLFVIFAAIRSLPGDGVVAYQAVACLFAGATAWLVERCARAVGASRRASLAAGGAYLLWLALLSGRGGQSPVFYNLWVASAALLTLRLPARSSARAVWWSGAGACALAGLAIQTKYTPAVEGALFGCAHLFYLRRVGAGWSATVAAAFAWIALALLPTLAAAWSYWRLGPVAWQAWWFGNFASISLRRGYPAAKIAMRLLGTWVQLAPLVVSAVLARRERSPAVALAWAWLAAALIAWASVGAFFDHYALPLLPPLAVLAALAWTPRPRLLLVSLAAALATLVVKAAVRPDDATGGRAVAAFVAAHDGGGCPYVFAGDSITYLLARACTPTRYAFPSTLSYASEQGSTGVDEAAEVRRIMARRPPAVVTLTEPLAPWNRDSLGVLRAALAHDYYPAFSAPEYGTRAIVYLRRSPKELKR